MTRDLYFTFNIRNIGEGLLLDILENIGQSRIKSRLKNLLFLLPNLLVDIYTLEEIILYNLIQYYIVKSRAESLSNLRLPPNRYNLEIILPLLYRYTCPSMFDNNQVYNINLVYSINSIILYFFALYTKTT
jgi:hypothetical protein